MTADTHGMPVARAPEGAPAQAGAAGAGEPRRRCVVTRASRPKEALLRFVVSPDGELVPDLAGRLPGRGIWLVPSRRLFEQAVARGLFQKAARGKIAVPADLGERIGEALSRRVLDALGLARRGGVVVLGFEQVRAALRAGGAALLVEASDASPDGRRKLGALAPELGVIDGFDAAILSAALGREHVVHAAVAGGRLAERVAAEWRRWAEWHRDAGKDRTGE
jgi:predicted RNA-binding protein YlxR (DUF448 family)